MINIQYSSQYLYERKKFLRNNSQLLNKTIKTISVEELMSSIKAPLEHAGLLNDQLSPTQARFLDTNRMALPSFKVFEIVGRRITRLDVEDLDIPYFNPQQDGSEDILSRYITVTLYPSIEAARAAEKAHIKSPGGLEDPSYLNREEIQRFRVTRTA